MSWICLFLLLFLSIHLSNSDFITTNSITTKLASTTPKAPLTPREVLELKLAGFLLFITENLELEHYEKLLSVEAIQDIIENAFVAIRFIDKMIQQHQAPKTNELENSRNALFNKTTELLLDIETATELSPIMSDLINDTETSITLFNNLLDQYDMPSWNRFHGGCETTNSSKTFNKILNIIHDQKLVILIQQSKNSNEAFKNTAKVIKHILHLSIVVDTSCYVILSKPPLLEQYLNETMSDLRELEIGVKELYDQLMKNFPWLVKLYFETPQDSNCIGTIISPNYILTAKHCVNTRMDTKVTVSYGNPHSSSFTNVTASKILKSYGKTFLNEDVALLQLDTPLKEIGNDSIIRLSKRKLNGTDNNVSVAAFDQSGYNSMIVNFINPSNCSDNVNAKAGANDFFEFCVEQTHSLQGPLVIHNGKSWIQVGIQSRHQGYEVFAKIHPYCSWIDEWTNHEVQCLDD